LTSGRSWSPRTSTGTGRRRPFSGSWARTPTAVPGSSDGDSMPARRSVSACRPRFGPCSASGHLDGSR
jgi:hypothetical protein